MPIPFDMMAVMLFIGYYLEAPPVPLPSVTDSLLRLGVAALTVFAIAFAANRIMLRLIRRTRLPWNERRRRAAGAEFFIRLLTIASFILVLENSALPWSLASHFGVKSGEAFLLQLAALLPYLLLFFCAWLPMYGLHKELSHGTWTRLGFLVHKARYNLFVLLAWLPFAFLADWLSGFLVALPVLFLLAAWAFPFLLARIWGCQPLTDPDTLRRVENLEATAGVRFSRVYLWEPGGGGVQNAAAVGIFRPFRYLFLTPALVRNMGGDELEAVILHELGHVRKKHLLFYLFTSMAGINLAVLLGAFLPLAGTGERFVVTTLLVLGYFRLVFGWLSRNMERQADLFALEKSGAARGLANALEKLALSAGNIRLAASWHHLGIAERVTFLRRAERERGLVKRHNARVNGIMAGGYLLSFVMIFAMARILWEEYAYAGQQRPAAIAAGEETHWRRVMLVMPGSPTAPLELAYSLAGKPEKHREAAAMAERAMRLSCGREQKAAAARLLADLGEQRLGCEDESCN